MKKNGWKVGGNPRFGGYATKNDQWTSFNEIKTVQLKANHILKNNYAGAALYFIDNDDFNNECCHGPSPLMNSIGMWLCLHFFAYILSTVCLYFSIIKVNFFSLGKVGGKEQ